MREKGQQADGFIELIKEYERIIHKVCGLYVKDQDDYKDLYQEIVLQTWRSYQKFKHEAKVSTWLYRIALNTAISHKRNNRKKLSIIPFDASFIQVADIKPETEDTYNMLQQMIAGLPELDKALILLYLEDNSYDEIAGIMGISSTNVGTRLTRIKEKLKKQVQIKFQEIN